MASYADNTVYLSIGGTVVHAYFKEVQLQPSNSSVETTAGAGVDDVQRAPGLNDHKIKITLSYDAANIQTYIQKIAVGQATTIDYGPESNTSGKPRHTQSFIITAADHTVSVDKSAVTLEISGDAAAAPTNNMFAGAIW